MVYYTHRCRDVAVAGLQLIVSSKYIAIFVILCNEICRYCHGDKSWNNQITQVCHIFVNRLFFFFGSAPVSAQNDPTVAYLYYVQGKNYICEKPELQNPLQLYYVCRKLCSPLLA